MERVKKNAYENRDMKITNDDQVYSHTISQINESRKVKEDRIKLDIKVAEQEEQDRLDKIERFNKNKENSDFLKKQMFGQKRKNLNEMHATICLNKSNQAIEQYQKDVYNRAKMSLISN